MSDTPRMVIVPAKVTQEMASAWDRRSPIGDKYVESQGDLDELVRGSPNAGKISRADLERADRAADEVRRKFIDKLYAENLPFGAIAGKALKRAEQDAFAAALGLQVAEDGEND